MEFDQIKAEIGDPLEKYENNRPKMDDHIPEILYHYCPTETFYSIATNKTLRMSSLTMSNDTMEGQWAVNIASDVCRSKLKPSYVERVISNIAQIPTVLNCVGLCLSEKRDLLSQWRGYADNGEGVCIGISRKALIDIHDARKINDKGINIEKIIYNKLEQSKIIDSEIGNIINWLENEDLIYFPPTILTPMDPEDQKIKEQKRDIAIQKMTLAILNLFPYLYKLKSDAFYEEAEWRVLRFIVADNYEGYNFRSTRKKIVPHDDLDCRICSEPFIKELILGPKHETPVPVMKGFLKGQGFPDALVEKSSATYR